MANFRPAALSVPLTELFPVERVNDAEIPLAEEMADAAFATTCGAVSLAGAAAAGRDRRRSRQSRERGYHHISGQFH